MAVQTQIQTRRGTAASWTSTNPTLAAGEIGFESDTGKFKIGNGSTAWASLAYSAGATAVTYLFNATAAQTTFSGADANGLTLAYTVGAEQVYLNGALQVRGSDYTATNGTSIVLTSGALVNDVLNVIAYSAMTITDTYTQAQADAKFFQTANAFVAGKNKIINGDFTVNQRSFTTTSTEATYGFDRWKLALSSGTGTYSAETFTPGTAPVAGYESTNFARLATTVGNDFCSVRQNIEDVRTFAGQTVTLSFWAKGTNPTTLGGLYAFWSQLFGSGGSSIVFDTIPTKIVLTANWTRYSLTFTLPSISGKTIGSGSSIQIGIGQGTSTSTESWTLDLWGVQLEAGSIATPFQTATGTKQGELAACQRYYYRVTAGVNDQYLGSVIPFSSTGASGYAMLPVPMRAETGVLEYSGLQLSRPGTGNTAVTSVSVGYYSNSTNAMVLPNVASGLTAGEFRFLSLTTSGTSYFGISAEL